MINNWCILCTTIQYVKNNLTGCANNCAIDDPGTWPNSITKICKLCTDTIPNCIQCNNDSYCT